MTVAKITWRNMTVHFCLFVLLWYGILTKIQCKLKNNILRNSSWSCFFFFFWRILFERWNNSDSQNILCILTWSSNQMKQMIWYFSPWVRQDSATVSSSMHFWFLISESTRYLLRDQCIPLKEDTFITLRCLHRFSWGN